MRRIFTTLVVGLGLWVLPSASFALTAELTSITPSADSVPIGDEGGGPPEDVALFGWLTQPNEVYTAVFAVDEEPSVVVTPGADIALNKRWSYDSASQTLTVEFTAKEMIFVDKPGDFPEGLSVSMLAIVPSVPIGVDGPPKEMNGAWMSTNLQQWEMIPPSEEQMAFGFKLTGPEGSQGFFRMFIPDALIDLLGQFNGQPLDIDELAVFNGDDQATLEITEVEGGAYVNLSVTFSSTTSGISALKSKGITKTITVQKQLPVSLSVKAASVKKGKNMQIYGWVNNRKANQSVTIMRKAKGESKFTTWKKVKTTKNGYFVVKTGADTTATYEARFGSKKSSQEKITVK